MKLLQKALFGVAAVAMLAAPAIAHRQWMLPSATVVSGDGNWVTVDAAVSNDLFYFEHQPMRLNNMKAYAPDGSEVVLQNTNTGRYRSTFDIELAQQGTYKIVNSGGGIMGSYKIGGEEKRLPRGATADQLASLIPADATDVKITESSMRNEIFVTSGEPTLTNFAIIGNGLEMKPITHPNDLVMGEQAQFQFLIDGIPAAGLEVEVIPGGIRTRDDLMQQDLKTDANGVLSIDWTIAGFYWISVEASDTKTTVPGATQRRLGYVTTLEVQAL